MSAYNEIKDCLYPELQRIRRENDYGYKQLYESANPAINVGPMIDDELVQLLGQGPTALTTYEKWGFMDDANTCIHNAQKIYTSMLLDENKKIADGTITASPGVMMKTIQLTRASDYSVTMFDGTVSSSVSSIRDLPTDKAADYFTYFCPSHSGTHTFQVVNMEVFYLWIKNEHALYDYLPRNSDINKESINATATAKFVRVDLKKGEYYPLRIHLYNGIAGSSSPVYIYNPDETSIYDDTTGHSYFNVLNGGNYMRKLLYYALFKPDRSMANYKCKFLDMTIGNYASIKALKANQPILYKKLIIPTPITYESYIYSESAGDGTQLQIKCPVGGKITVVNASWGKGDIRINEPSYETRTHTDPRIIVDNNTVKYEWTTPNADLVSYTHHTPSYDNGFTFEQFEGNSNGNPTWYNGKTYANQTNQSTQSGTHNFPTIEDMKYESPNHSVRITGNLYAAHGGGHNNNWPGTVLVLQLESSPGCEARLQIYDKVYTSNGNRVGDDNKHNLVGIPWNTAVPITLWSSKGTVNVYVKRWGRTGGRNKKWRGKSVWTDMKGAIDNKWITVNHSYYTVTRTPQADTLNATNITTQTYLDPAPTYQVEMPNIVTYKGNVDLTQQIQLLVNNSTIASNDGTFEVHTLDGNYETTYTPLLPNIVAQAQLNKQLIIHYKYEIDLTGDDVTNKQLYVDETGQFVISYDYNAETSTYPIAPALNENQLCIEDQKCNYTLTLEDDATLTTKSGTGLIASRSLREDLNADLSSLGLSFDDIMVNHNWKNDPIDIYSTLNNGDILTNEIVSLEEPLKVRKSIRSDNGKFKFTFEDTDLCIYYCIPAFDTQDGVDYTSNVHRAVYSSDATQYFYLHRPTTNPLAGQIVSTHHHTTTGTKDLKLFLPVAKSQILVDGSVNTIAGKYPVICGSQSGSCNADLNFANFDGLVDNPNYFYFDISNIEQCAKACNDADNCQHFFHINSSTGGQKCLRDAASNPNPLTTNINPDPQYISSSSVNMRTYTVNGADPDCYSGSQVLPISVNNISDYTTLYNEQVDDHVNKIGICGDTSYNEISDYINSANGFFSSGTPYTSRPGWLQCNTIQENFANYKGTEGFDGTCGTSQCLVDELDQIAATRAAQFNESQQQVGVMETQIDNQYHDLGVNVKKKDLQRITKEIPSKFTKKFYSARPQTTMMDARENDTKEIAVYENSLYTIATLTAATVLITSIILIRE